MKKSVRIICAAIALLLVALTLLSLFVGCSAPKSSAAPAPAEDYDASYNKASQAEMAPAAPAAPAEAPMAPPMPAPDMADESQSGAGAGGSGGLGLPDQNAKIIRRGYLEFMSKNFDADLKKIKDMVISSGGFVDNSNISGKPPVQWNDSGRFASMTLRIPSEKLDAFWGNVVTVGQLLNQQIGSEDVSAQYFDTDSRVKTLRIQLERLESILTKSEKLADIIALETEIARVRYEIESLTTQLTQWDRLVSYSTVEVRLTEETTVTRPPEESPEFRDRASVAFKRSINGAIDFLKNFAIFLIALVPVLPIFAVVALIVWLIVRAAKRSRGKVRINKQEKFKISEQKNTENDKETKNE